MTDRRPRRIGVGADAARVWARELSLGNPYAKAIMLALANYMNEDGSAYPGLATISRDTDITQDTVMKRLRWLESIGAIVVLKCWLDENGRRNHDGRGRITSSEIRFLLDADPAEIEAAARAATEPRPLRGAAKSSAESGDVSTRPDGEQIDENGTRPHRVQNYDLPPIGTPIAPERYPTPAGYHIEEDKLEQEREESPQPPSGGAVDILDGWDDFQRAWQEPIIRQSLAQQVWAALNPAEREFAQRAARGYVAWRNAQKKPPNVLGAHLFLKERDAWARFAELALGKSGAAATNHMPNGSDGAKAVSVAYEMAGLTAAIRGLMRANDGGVWYRLDVTPQLLALAKAPAASNWLALEYQQASAWNGFLEKVVTVDAWRRLHAGSRAPWPWPPRKDGSISTGPPDTLMTDQDEKDAAMMGKMTG